MKKTETEIIEQSGDDDYDAAVLFYYEKLRLLCAENIKTRIQQTNKGTQIR